MENQSSNIPNDINTHKVKSFVYGSSHSFHMISEWFDQLETDQSIPQKTPSSIKKVPVTNVSSKFKLAEDVLSCFNDL